MLNNFLDRIEELDANSQRSVKSVDFWADWGLIDYKLGDPKNRN